MAVMTAIKMRAVMAVIGVIALRAENARIALMTAKYLFCASLDRFYDLC